MEIGALGRVYQDGEIIVPLERPGLGVELDQRKMDLYTRESFQIEPID